MNNDRHTCTLEQSQPGLVSILMPCYNAGRWLRAAVESVLAQTWPDWELVIVDDGSRDDTLAIARSFESDRIRVVAQSNQGASAARNRALKESRGRYIQWLDADDLLDPQKLARQMEAALSLRNPRVLLSSAWSEFYCDLNQARPNASALWADLTPLEWMHAKVRDNLWMCIESWLTSRELCEAAGPWDETLLRDNDGEYFSRVVCASERVCFVPTAWSYVRRANFGSVSSSLSLSDAKLDSMVISLTRSTRRLLALEDSPRTRAACIALLQRWLIYFYPQRPDLVARARGLAEELGGELHAPSLPWKYAWIRRLFGWRAAKQARAWVPKLRQWLAIHRERTSGTCPEPAPTRDHALDFTRGVLVALMVVYHAMNYFMHVDRALQYLRFLAPAFVFLSGFLATSIYVRKYDGRTGRMCARLALRGLKLIVLFTILNLLIHGLLESNYNNRPLGLDLFLASASDVYLVGNSRAASFEVLLPIAYVLLFMAALLRVAGGRVWRVALLTAVFVLLCALASVWPWTVGPNARLASMGVLGALAGFLPRQRVVQLSRFWLPLLVVYGVYSVSVARSAMPTLLPLDGVGMVLLLLVFYGWGLTLPAAGWLSAETRRLGRHSLVGYILQIGLLQILHAVAPALPAPVLFTLSAAGTLCVLILFIHAVELTCGRWPVMDRLYRSIFA